MALTIASRSLVSRFPSARANRVDFLAILEKAGADTPIEGDELPNRVNDHLRTTGDPMSDRSNADWLRDLRGAGGHEAQRRAHEDLARYLYVVAYNYVRLRQADLGALAAFAAEDLAALAQDFVQDTLEKFVQADFRLLGRYRGEGRFTSWAAQIVRNQAAMELRKSYWKRRDVLPDADTAADDDREVLTQRQEDAAPGTNPEQSAARAHVASVLQLCLERLPERNRLAITHCIADDERAEQVARSLNTTANAVYLLITRGKRQLKECLQHAGISRDVLSIFEGAS